MDLVLSTLAAIDSETQRIDPDYNFSGGTSMAAPHMAGVLALMKS
mgnify:FL=1